MRIKKRKKCEVEDCENGMSEVRDFPVTMNMFDKNANPISGETKKAIEAWRSIPYYCTEHLNQQ